MAIKYRGVEILENLQLTNKFVLIKLIEDLLSFEFSERKIAIFKTSNE